MDKEAVKRMYDAVMKDLEFCQENDIYIQAEKYEAQLTGIRDTLVCLGVDIEGIEW